MPAIRTKKNFNQLPDGDVSKALGTTSAGFLANVALPDPEVTPADVDLLKIDFDKKIVKANKGGSLSTAIKNAARAVSINALNKNASYTDLACDEDLSVLLSSNYEAVSTNRAQVVLDAPVVIGSSYPQKGQIKLRVSGDSNRKAVQGRIKAVGGEYGPAISFRSAKAIIFGALASGTTYVMQLCGIGGSTGQSDWSATVTKIAN
jgi:hypothetical protein